MTVVIEVGILKVPIFVFAIPEVLFVVLRISILEVSSVLSKLLFIISIILAHVVTTLIVIYIAVFPCLRFPLITDVSLDGTCLALTTPFTRTKIKICGCFFSFMALAANLIFTHVVLPSSKRKVAHLQFPSFHVVGCKHV